MNKKRLNWIDLIDKNKFKKMNKKCYVCGVKEYLQIHHIIPRSIGGSEEWDNLILLCKKHHLELHKISEKCFYKNDKYFLELLKKMKLG